MIARLSFILITLLIIVFAAFRASALNDQFNIGDTIPLSFSRNYGSGAVTGLSPTVVVKNAKTGATLLASTAMTETISGNGIYTYNWATTGLFSKTECVVTYTVGSTQFSEYLTISDTELTGRAQ